MISVNDNTAEAFVNTIKSIGEWSFKQRLEYYEKMKQWVINTRTWTAQVSGLSHWLESVLKDR